MRTNEKDIGESERREGNRYAAKLNVNYRHGDTYLYSRTSNVSELGIFLVSDDPLPKGAILALEFQEPGSRHPMRINGQVRWVETGRGYAEPGMGIQFIDLTDELRERIKRLVRTVAYIE